MQKLKLLELLEKRKNYLVHEEPIDFTGDCSNFSLTKEGHQALEIIMESLRKEFKATRLEEAKRKVFSKYIEDMKTFILKRQYNLCHSLGREPKRGTLKEIDTIDEMLDFFEKSPITTLVGLKAKSIETPKLKKYALNWEETSKDLYSLLEAQLLIKDINKRFKNIEIKYNSANKKLRAISSQEATFLNGGVQEYSDVVREAASRNCESLKFAMSDAEVENWLCRSFELAKLLVEYL